MLSEAKPGLTGKVTISSARRDSSIVEPEAFAPEQDAGALAGPRPRRAACAPPRPAPRTGLKPSRSRAVVAKTKLRSAIAAARSSNTAAAVDDMVGLARRGARLVVRPAVARIDQPEFRQAEIGHGARHHADILAELRLDEDDRRAVAASGRLRCAGIGGLRRPVSCDGDARLPHCGCKTKHSQHAGWRGVHRGCYRAPRPTKIQRNEAGSMAKIKVANPGRRARRRRDDPHHLAVHQGQADPPLSRHRPRNITTSASSTATPPTTR